MRIRLFILRTYTLLYPYSDQLVVMFIMLTS